MYENTEALLKSCVKVFSLSFYIIFPYGDTGKFLIRGKSCDFRFEGCHCFALCVILLLDETNKIIKISKVGSKNILKVRKLSVSGEREAHNRANNTQDVGQ